MEFAKIEREKGKSAFDAAMGAARMRFRPILMTAFSFILGVLPLLVASGAGAEARKVMGVTVFSGMLVATVVGVLVEVPVMLSVVWLVNGTRDWYEKPFISKGGFSLKFIAIIALEFFPRL